MYTYIYIYIYMYTHVYTYIYIYICKQGLPQQDRAARRAASPPAQATATAIAVRGCR